jgi:MOSC domain-containing protein YiiM
MTSARIRSVNVGRRQELAASSTGVTGIAKRGVPAIEVRAPGTKHGGLGSGVVGDFIGERRHHGGDQQAVYAVAREELDVWSSELGRPLPDGMFGENLTTEGLDVDAAVMGQQWQVGDEVVLRVCGPRIPCRTFAARMGEPHWVRRFAERGRSGAYLAVEVPGTVRPGDRVRPLQAPAHALDVRVGFRAFMGDLEAAQDVLDAGCLHPQDEAELRDLVRRRRG